VDSKSKERASAVDNEKQKLYNCVERLIGIQAVLLVVFLLLSFVNVYNGAGGDIVDDIFYKAHTFKAYVF